MKTIAALPLLALALAACAPYLRQPGTRSPIRKGRRAEPYPTGLSAAGLSAAGLSPDQGYPQPGPPMPPGGPVYPGPGQPTIRRQAIRPARPPTARSAPSPSGTWRSAASSIFTDRGNNVSVSEPTPSRSTGRQATIYRTQRLEVNIVHRQCSDGMSDRSYPDTVEVRVDGRQRYRGCGAPIAYFEQVGETGQPNYPAATVPPDSPLIPLPGQPYRSAQLSGARQAIRARLAEDSPAGLSSAGGAGAMI